MKPYNKTFRQDKRHKAKDCDVCKEQISELRTPIRGSAKNEIRSAIADYIENRTEGDECSVMEDDGKVIGTEVKTVVFDELQGSYVTGIDLADGKDYSAVCGVLTSDQLVKFKEELYRNDRKRLSNPTDI